METKLNLTTLTNAVSELAEGLERYQQHTSDSLIRDGLLQRFKRTYEISHKILKRYLEMTSATSEQFDTMPFQDLIRTGNEAGLLRSDWPTWRRYRELRAKTSHTYSEDVALIVVAEIPDFLQEARYLLNEFQKRSV